MILKDYIKINPNFPTLQKTKVCLTLQEKKIYHFRHDYRR